ncbi:MAG TPA: hypothetical protein VER03_08265 [Bryobacteraceae bacterium]|nr:hypothetical protein [Bryobacteraceae bacterium]
MKVRLVLLACAVVCLRAEGPRAIPAPFYTPSSIVNAASFKAGALAPNTIGTLYGRDLAFTTRAVSNEDLYNGTLPTTLLGTGVRLLVGGNLAFLYYVSPTQINFLIPPNLPPGPRQIQLVLDGRAAESVRVELAAVSPALFALDPETALATRVDGRVITAERPATPSEIVILYATGLGETRPKFAAGQMPNAAAWIERRADFQVTLNGEPVDRAAILYAGVAPGFAGLYQVNLKLPDTAPANPEIRIGFGGENASPTGVRLPIRASNP